VASLRGVEISPGEDQDVNMARDISL
jgi:hypothetical protein